MTDKNPLALSWDQRYSSETYAYGKNANAFFAAQLEHMNPGRLLLPDEGEGRNAVYAAGLGWAVEAFDFLQNHYDLVALLFFHTDAVNRKYLHQKAIQILKPGGTLLLEAFHKDQLSKNTGGPKSPALLFDEDTLAADFLSLETHLLEKRKILLDEGSFHQGEAEIIRYTGIKPK